MGALHLGGECPNPFVYSVCQVIPLIVMALGSQVGGSRPSYQARFCLAGIGAWVALPKLNTH